MVSISADFLLKEPAELGATLNCSQHCPVALHCYYLVGYIRACCFVLLPCIPVFAATSNAVSIVSIVSTVSLVSIVSLVSLVSIVSIASLVSIVSS